MKTGLGRAGRLVSARLSLGLGLCLLLQTLALAAASNSMGDLTRSSVREWQKTLDDTEKELKAPDMDSSRLSGLKEDLTHLADVIRQSRDKAQEQARLVNSDLDALGPAPSSDAPVEAPNVVARRNQLTSELATAEGTVKESDLLLAQLDRATESIKRLQLGLFTRQVFMRMLSPLDAAFWAAAVPDWNRLWEKISAEALASCRQTPWLRLALALLTALGLAFVFRYRLSRHIAASLEEGEPGYFQKLRFAVLSGLLRASLPSLAVMALFLGAGAFPGPTLQSISAPLLVSVTLVSMVSGFLLAALRPHRPELRLVDVSDATAGATWWVSTLLAILFATDYLLSLLMTLDNGSVAAMASQDIVFGLLVALTLTALLDRRLWKNDPETGISQCRRFGRSLWGLLIVAITVSALLGYVSLAYLLAGRVVGTVALMALAALLMRIIEEMTTQFFRKDSSFGVYLSREMALSPEGCEMLGFWVGLALKSIVLLAGGVSLLLLWSLDQQDALIWLTSVFKAFQLGEVTISPVGILEGLLLFAALLVVTRVLQKTLEQKVFPRTNLDNGIRHSIRTGIGYAGFMLAAMFAASAMGISLSSLAIIAGALSVGLGFGLQNIVNNFVSGLILLIERPIKAGDLVTVGEHQGRVSKISVRATEIITADKASVFIPNASLISGAVTNRSYSDRLCKLVMTVNLAFESSPEKARELMLERASRHPGVRPSPAPAVYMTGLNGSSLSLELVVFIHDANKVKAIRSELGFELHADFREQGICLAES